MDRCSCRIIVILCVVSTSFIYAVTLKVATYNILNFPDAAGRERIDDFRTVFAYLNTDIVVVQEMQSQEGVNLFLDSVLNYYSKHFDAIPFHDGPDTDNALFFRTDNIEFLTANYLRTTNRDIAEYRMKVRESQTIVYIYSVHFKSSEGGDNETLRFEEATVLRNHLDSLSPGTNVLVMGDFNIYHSDEPAFKKLTDESGQGCLYDPLSLLGSWHDNSVCAYAHTQSTRAEQLPDGGAGGGLDDRFDIILCSHSLCDSADMFMVPYSYTICGNDGNHFDESVNSSDNQSVPQGVANALYYASDHLPVLVSITERSEEPQSEKIIVYPNPVRREAHIVFPQLSDFIRGKLYLTNILGQCCYRSEISNSSGCILARGNLQAGVYFLHAVIDTKYRTYSYRTTVAVTD